MGGSPKIPSTVACTTVDKDHRVNDIWLLAAGCQMSLTRWALSTVVQAINGHSMDTQWTLNGHYNGHYDGHYELPHETRARV